MPWASIVMKSSKRDRIPLIKNRASIRQPERINPLDLYKLSLVNSVLLAFKPTTSQFSYHKCGVAKEYTDGHVDDHQRFAKQE